MDEDFPMIGKGWPVGPSRSAIPGAGLFQVAATVVEVEAVEAVESFVLLRLRSNRSTLYRGCTGWGIQGGSKSRFRGVRLTTPLDNPWSRGVTVNATIRQTLNG
jgi:hypothetical protein